jgi:hypothetical protein
MQLSVSLIFYQKLGYVSGIIVLKIFTQDIIVDLSVSQPLGKDNFVPALFPPFLNATINV